jgi:hypothetical protein
MMDNVQISLLSLMLLLPAAAALAEEPPQVIENTNAALQQNVFSLRRVPRECTGIAPQETCWEIYPTAWQSYSKEKKGISLTINLWVSDAAQNTKGTVLKLTFSIDGNMIDRKNVHFEPGSHSFEGATATLNDEPLVRSIGNGAEVWLGAGTETWYATHLNSQMTVKLTPEVLTGIEAVLNKYDSLDSAETRLQRLNAKRLESVNDQLSGLALEFLTSLKRWQALQLHDPGCNAASCLNEQKAAMTAVLHCAESISKLLDEKIDLLASQPQDSVILKDTKESTENRDKTRILVNNYKAVLATLDKKLAQTKAAGR